MGRHTLHLNGAVLLRSVFRCRMRKQVLSVMREPGGPYEIYLFIRHNAIQSNVSTHSQAASF